MSDFTVFTNNPFELRARLEAGHRVEYRFKGKSYICERRGQEYVTVCAESDAAARAEWDRVHEAGYYYDWKSNQRVTIPGAR